MTLTLNLYAKGGQSKIPCIADALSYVHNFPLLITQLLGSNDACGQGYCSRCISSGTGLSSVLPLSTTFHACIGVIVARCITALNNMH